MELATIGSMPPTAWIAFEQTGTLGMVKAVLNMSEWG